MLYVVDPKSYQTVAGPRLFVLSGSGMPNLNLSAGIITPKTPLFGYFQARICSSVLDFASPFVRPSVSAVVLVKRRR